MVSGASSLTVTLPMPDVVGLHLDPKEIATVESVAEGSSSETNGFQVGDKIVTLQGQPILSIADVQWVLQQVPADGGSVALEVRRGDTSGAVQLKLEEGWRGPVLLTWLYRLLEDREERARRERERKGGLALRRSPDL